MSTTLTGKTAFFQHMRDAWNLSELHAVALFDDVQSAEATEELPLRTTVNGQAVTIDVDLADDGDTPVWIIY